MSDQPVIHCRPTERYRAQNHEIRRILIELEGVIEFACEPESSDVCGRLVLALNRKFTVHMQLQDACLYPRLDNLLTSGEKRKVSACKEELRRRRAECADWALRWGPMAMKIDDRASFVQETRLMLERLRAGLVLEINEVFPLVDELGWPALTGVG